MTIKLRNGASIFAAFKLSDGSWAAPATLSVSRTATNKKYSFLEHYVRPCIVCGDTTDYMLFAHYTEAGPRCTSCVDLESASNTQGYHK